jgi:hypothetical protein
MRESIVEEDVALGTRIFRVHDRLFSGARSFRSNESLVKLRAHDLDLYRASCSFDPESSRDIRGRRCH